MHWEYRHTDQCNALNMCAHAASEFDTVENRADDVALTGVLSQAVADEMRCVG